MRKYILHKGTQIFRRKVGCRWGCTLDEEFVAERTAIYTDKDLDEYQTDMAVWIYFAINDPDYAEIGVLTEDLEIVEK